MYVLHIPTVDTRTYVYRRKLSTAVIMYLVPNCSTYVSTPPTWHSYNYRCTSTPTAHNAVPTDVRKYVPTVRTALTNFIWTHLLHTVLCSADECTYLLLYVLSVAANNVRKETKAEISKIGRG